MKNNATKKTDVFLIDPRNIVVEDGFNVRRDFDLDELKEQIKAKGVLNPLTVIAFKDENGDEKYRLVDGERRFRATMIAISEGADIPFVKALKRPPTMSREDLYIEQMMRNEGKRFTEYECALMFQRFKEEFGYTQVEIADKFKKSPAYISKCLSLLEGAFALLKQLYVFSQSLYGQASAAHTFDKLNPIAVRVLIVADSAAGSLNGWQQADLFVITKGIGGKGVFDGYFCDSHLMLNLLLYFVFTFERAGLPASCFP